MASTPSVSRGLDEDKAASGVDKDYRVHAKACGFRDLKPGESAHEYVVDIASEEPVLSEATTHRSVHHEHQGDNPPTCQRVSGWVVGG